MDEINGKGWEWSLNRVTRLSLTEKMLVGTRNLATLLSQGRAFQMEERALPACWRKNKASKAGTE